MASQALNLTQCPKDVSGWTFQPGPWQLSPSSLGRPSPILPQTPHTSHLIQETNWPQNGTVDTEFGSASSTMRDFGANADQFIACAPGEAFCVPTEEDFTFPISPVSLTHSNPGQWDASHVVQPNTE